MNRLSSFHNQIQKKFAPDQKHFITTDQQYLLDQRKLAKLVGLVAVFLPLVLFSSWFFGVPFKDSISHHYYSKFFGTIFVIVLSFIGTFLIAYRGESKWENTLATLAGFCAFGIALFPISGPGFEFIKSPDGGSFVLAFLFVPLDKVAGSESGPIIEISKSFQAVDLFSLISFRL